ncbi:hypothetical protein RhiirA1_395254 [Rhizophagus irregularis]|uniref:Uncharacterized protein n=1 Tax=Rhizophagus irregularis TaxID=588596 RepID=A0A2N0RQC1_9GLOM|nr:hypothetical protein RhiirA1_395254 [Rhizophagus irregularis]
MTSAKPVTLPERIVKESTPACKSVTSGNKSSAGTSPRPGIETWNQCLKTITRKRLLDESSVRTYKESQRQTRHGRNIPNYCESEESEYEPKRIRRESNTNYSQITESQQSATLYLTPPMTEVVESSSSNSNLENLDGSKNKNPRSQFVHNESSSRESTHVQVQLVQPHIL